MLSVAIQTHETRAPLATALNECLGETADVVFDPDPDEPLRSPWRTYRRALEETPEGATHRLIVQDDILVADYFLDGVRAAVAARPDRVIVFFVSGALAPYRLLVTGACAAGATWAEFRLGSWIPVVATVWPVALIPEILDFDTEKRASGVWPPGFVADDEIVGRFLSETGQAPPLAIVPSTVEHPDTVSSIMKGFRRVGDDPGRRAAVWIGNYPECYGCDARRLNYADETTFRIG